MHVYARATSARKFWVAIVVFVVAALAVVVTPAPIGAVQLSSSGGAHFFNRPEKCLMTKINQARRNSGRRALEWDRQLGYVARVHARNMASRSSVWHDSTVGNKVTRWNRLGQNTGRGGKCTRIFRAFMNSSGHRANIFGRWRFQGVGAEWRNNHLYVQHLFESRRNPGNIWSAP